MAAPSDEQEFAAFVLWAQDKGQQEIEVALAALAETSEVARSQYLALLGSSAYGSAIGSDRPAVYADYTGYCRGHSQNWEHEGAGNAMNYSGVYDDVMSAFATNEGWKPDEDYTEPGAQDDEEI